LKNNLGIIIGMVGGVVLSFTLGFLVEQFDTSIGTIEGIESYLKLPVVGVIPYLPVESEKEKPPKTRFPSRRSGVIKDKVKQIQSQLLIYYSVNSPIAEAYKILRTNIQMDIFKGSMQNKIILISSAGPEEGKSITCANLAIAMAQTGNRVLVIDADLRRTSMYRIFGLNKSDHGLADILRKTAELDETVKTFSDLLIGNLILDKALHYPGIDNLNILLAGSIPHLPSELLSSNDLNALLETLKAEYDVILIDSPPVLAVADAIILASRVDAVILVYKVGKTARNAIMRAKVQLEAVNAPCKGIILNNISREVEMRSAYYYHYKYYGEKKEKPKAEGREI
jgi:Mrp family chromosome partitioning ATPase